MNGTTGPEQEPAMLCFFDTNILVCLFDTSDPVRQQQAAACFQTALDQHTIVLSTQVLHEFYAVTTRKLKPRLPPDVAAQQVRQLCTFHVLDSTPQSVTAAIDLEQMHRLSGWEALILEAATRAKAQVLYSEDFNHGQLFGSLTVINPFLTGPVAPAGSYPDA